VRRARATPAAIVVMADVVAATALDVCVCSRRCRVSTTCVRVRVVAHDVASRTCIAPTSWRRNENYSFVQFNVVRCSFMCVRCVYKREDNAVSCIRVYVCVYISV
jgi:hypothetical protein